MISAAAGTASTTTRCVSNARLLALMQVAIADAAIGCWEAKYTYVFWRPVTAIPLADTDGNPATTLDAELGPAVRHAGSSRVPVRPLVRQRGGERRARGPVRRADALQRPVGYDARRHALVPQLLVGARGREGRPDLRGHPLPESAPRTARCLARAWPSTARARRRESPLIRGG